MFRAARSMDLLGPLRTEIERRFAKYHSLLRRNRDCQGGAALKQNYRRIGARTADFGASRAALGQIGLF